MGNFKNNSNSHVWRGIIILLIGVAFLLPTLGIYIPRWIFGWYTFVLALGIYLGSKRNFQGGGWLAMVLVGAYFTLRAIPGLDFDFSKYALGVGFVILGAFIILKPKNRFKRNRYDDSLNPSPSLESTELNTENDFNSKIDNIDTVYTSAVFGGSNQIVYSKNFKGGEINVVFGGADVNFSQADFIDTVIIDVTAVFGGIKLIVPQNWIIKSNVTPIFGSVDDKRGNLIPAGEVQKILVLEGTIMFGGVEIKSF